MAQLLLRAWRGNVLLKLDQYKTVLSPLLKETRFEHSLRVSQTCVQLAERFGQDSESLAVAGLLHDAAKYLSPDRLEGYGVPKEEREEAIFSRYPEVWHAMVAPSLLSHFFGIEDRSILDAVKWHSTGTESMSVFSKIVFVADFIEPGRRSNRAETVRKLSETCLDEASLMISGFMMTWLLSQHQLIFPHTLFCYNDLLNRVGKTRVAALLSVPFS